MNPELLKKIEYYKLNDTSSKNTIRDFLSVKISAKLYDEIEGDKISNKVETIYNYLQNIVKEPEVKLLLNIVIADDSSSLEYVSYLKEKYEVVVHKSSDVKNPKDIDLVLFTGGEDVNPELYGEKIGKYTSINENRDNKEIDVFYKFKGSSFLLGICRGNQLLTVLNGGKLVQHVEGHCRDHSIICNGSRYIMTSSHHQMIYPFDLNKNSYKILAYSEYFQSKTYLNGDNEEIELSKDFLEPEIVYYNNSNSLCIQGHPEWSHCEKRTSNMCLNLIDKYLKEFKDIKEKNNLDHYKTFDISDLKYSNDYYGDNDENNTEIEHEFFKEEEI